MTAAPRGTGLPYSISALYVGDLHPEVTEAMLFDKFQTAGPIVSIRVCRDTVTKRSLGYGYVNFQQAADAERALDSLNYEQIRGRSIRIMWSQRDPTLRRSGVGNIFIKNLDKNIDNKSLHDTFSAFGNVLSCKIMSNDDGESLGFGFVHFEKEEAAKQAIEKVNGMLLDGKKVFVGEFISRDKRLANSEPQKFTNVFVKNFDNLFDDEKLKEIFSRFGEITSCVVAKDNNGVSRGFGFCNFQSPENAARCVDELKDLEIEGRKIYVLRFKNKYERAADRKRILQERKAERMTKYVGVNLYVKHLDESVDDAKLKEAFQGFGTIISAKVMVVNGRSRGFGFVCFSAPDEATRAVTEMNGRIIGSKPLYVALAQVKEQRRAYLAQEFAQRMGQQRYPHGPISLPYNNGIAHNGYHYVPNPLMVNGSRQMVPRTIVANTRAQQRWPVGPMNSMNQNIYRHPMQNTMNGRLPSTQGSSGAENMPRMQQMTAYTATARNMPITNTPVYPNVVRGEQTALTAANLVNASPRDQKQMLGESLYPLILQLKGPELAGKITGMLLELDNTEILHLIESNDALRAKVSEAEMVLRTHAQKQGAAANAAMSNVNSPQLHKKLFDSFFSRHER